MKHLQKFNSWLNEAATTKLTWVEMDFPTHGEKEVADVTEETLLTKNLFVICEGEDLFKKLTQITSTEKGELVLETNGHDLILFTTPFEFIQWNKLGASDEEIIDSCFIIKGEDLNKI